VRKGLERKSFFARVTAQKRLQRKARSRPTGGGHAPIELTFRKAKPSAFAPAAPYRNPGRLFRRIPPSGRGAKIPDDFRGVIFKPFRASPERIPGFTAAYTDATKCKPLAFEKISMLDKHRDIRF
jgi:hypothetical protein